MNFTIEKKKGKVKKKKSFSRSTSVMITLSDPDIINYMFKKTSNKNKGKQDKYLNIKVTDNIKEILKNRIYYTGREVFGKGINCNIKELNVINQKNINNFYKKNFFLNPS